MSEANGNSGKSATLYKQLEAKIDELYRFRDRFYVLEEEEKGGSDDEKDLVDDSRRRRAVSSRLAALLDEIDDERKSQDNVEVADGWAEGERYMSSSSSSLDKASRLVLRGKALNVMPEYDERAFEALTRAIKLEPGSCDAWNALAECYWKSKDFDMCRNCFERSLAIKPTKTALRGMSMVMRQLMKIPTSATASGYQ